jgi:hypothetical protein
VAVERGRRFEGSSIYLASPPSESGGGMQTAPGSGSLRINRLTEQIQAVLSAIGRPVSLEDSRDVLARDAESNQRRDRRSDADAWLGLRAGGSAHPAGDNCGADLACGPNGVACPRAQHAGRGEHRSRGHPATATATDRPFPDTTRAVRRRSACCTILLLVSPGGAVGSPIRFSYSSVKQNARQIGVSQDLSTSVFSISTRPHCGEYGEPHTP